MEATAAEVLDRIKARNPGQPAFHQAVEEVVGSLAPVLERHPEYRSARVLERLAEPDRIIIFRVEWLATAASSGSIAATGCR
jgi:glutamate dehydrogenase (NADP+)